MLDRYHMSTAAEQGECAASVIQVFVNSYIHTHRIEVTHIYIHTGLYEWHSYIHTHRIESTHIYIQT